MESEYNASPSTGRLIIMVVLLKIFLVLIAVGIPELYLKPDDWFVVNESAVDFD